MSIENIKNISKEKSATDVELIEAVEKNLSPDTLIEFLKDPNNKYEITKHQLGFTKIKISSSKDYPVKNIRLHIWEKSSDIEDIHDHFSDFTSFILYGSIENSTYNEVSSGAQYHKKLFNCGVHGCYPVQKNTEIVQLSKIKSEVFRTGDYYISKADTLHKINIITEIAITFVVQNQYNEKPVSVYRAFNEKLEFSESELIEDSNHFEHIMKCITTLSGVRNENV